MRYISNTTDVIAGRLLLYPNPLPLSSVKKETGFMGLINTVAPKNPVKRATSTPTTAQQKKQALIQWCQRMTADKDVRLLIVENNQTE